MEVSTAFSKIIHEGRQPKNLQTDDGKEFFNNNFSTLLKKYNINHYSTYSTMKASIVERFNRTLKEKMWKNFSLTGSYNWINSLQKMLFDYNHTIHRTIKTEPSNVTKRCESRLLNTVYNHMKIFDEAKYKIGNYVRILKYKTNFEKGYTPSWTTEIFKIRKVQLTNPVTYLLEDYLGNPILGGFYEFELQKTKYPKNYLVEKVLRRKGDHLYVKYLGFKNNHNSWIHKKNLL